MSKEPDYLALVYYNEQPIGVAPMFITNKTETSEEVSVQYEIKEEW